MRSVSHWNTFSPNSWTISSRSTELLPSREPIFSWFLTTRQQQPTWSGWPAKLVRITAILSTRIFCQWKSTLSPHYSSNKILASLKTLTISAEKRFIRWIVCLMETPMISRWRVKSKTKSNLVSIKRIIFRLSRRRPKSSGSKKQSWQRVNKNRKILRHWWSKASWYSLTLSSRAHLFLQNLGPFWRNNTILLGDFTSAGSTCPSHPW